MEIYRISCVVLFILMIVSFSLLAVFPFTRHKENFYMQMLNNLNVGFFSGLLVSFCTTYVGYFYAKEDFFNTLIRQSSYIYTNLHTMQRNLADSDYESNSTHFFQSLPVVLSHLETYTNAVESDAKMVNFLEYSPFFKNNESYRRIESLNKLFYEFKKYPDFFVRMRFLESERNLALTDNDSNALTIVNGEIVKFMGDLSTSVNGDIQVLDAFMSKLENEYNYPDTPWESFKKLVITPQKSEKHDTDAKKTNDKDIKKE